MKNNTISHDLVTVAHLIHYFKTQTKSQSNQFPFHFSFAFLHFMSSLTHIEKSMYTAQTCWEHKMMAKIMFELVGEKGYPRC